MLSPDFVKSFRLCHFRRKKWKVKISSMWESIVVRKFRGSSNQFRRIV
ncbi:hypothetical protein LEP1GSC179_0159 [Leptospira santarosai str. MOR084]|uniref:Uncharacterized protein n=1 Tax=Leptospira santarosai str. MOR084 TaxID=1049984 RepID=A0A0E2BCQ8_9LEPT|nr:hypothetical protein LEP1GSC179_0159 [Leptospira santarosai str. MOR084]